MTPNPTSTTSQITIEGKQYEMHFDLNTYAAFEQVSGKFFPDFLADLQTAISEGLETVAEKDKITGKIENKIKDPMALIRKVSFKMLRAFVWAACHSYTSDDEAVWPFTINQLGKRLTMQTLIAVLPALVSGTRDNLPKPKEGSAGSKPIDEAPTTSATGGIASGPEDADALASLEPVSEG